uniref:Centromere protein K n=1 Tax=Salarias fasciatus TaxID=181472 RepID=A0A672GQ17_SALFA
MLKLCSELEMVASCYEAKRNKLRETKEVEQKWLEETKKVFTAVSDHIQKMKSYQERLMSCLGDILEKHVPPLNKELSANAKKKNIQDEITENLISLNEMLEMLMNKVLSTPHDPYLTIDETFWPPYVELLLRHGIAVRHQENNFKIRLETFF